MPADSQSEKSVHPDRGRKLFQPISIDSVEIRCEWHFNLINSLITILIYYLHMVWIRLAKIRFNVIILLFRRQKTQSGCDRNRIRGWQCEQGLTAPEASWRGAGWRFQLVLNHFTSLGAEGGSLTSITGSPGDPATVLFTTAASAAATWRSTLVAEERSQSKLTYSPVLSKHCIIMLKVLIWEKLIIVSQVPAAQLITAKLLQ